MLDLIGSLKDGARVQVMWSLLVRGIPKIINGVPKLTGVTTVNLNTQRPNKPPPYPLLQFLTVFLAGMIAVRVIIAVEPWALVLGYPMIGAVISRFVYARVIWWNQANSLENVFQAKLMFWLLWPYQLPRLILKVAIARYF